MIYVVLGRSGSGKSSIERAVERQTGLKRIVSDTSRPKRVGESDSVDYNFISKVDFEYGVRNKMYVEYSRYNGWYYGINKKNVDIENEDYICVTNPSGYRRLKKEYGDSVVGIVIHTEDKQRLINYLTREENPDCYECCRRFLADVEDFFEIEKDPNLHHVKNIIGGLNRAINDVICIINKTK